MNDCEFTTVVTICQQVSMDQNVTAVWFGICLITRIDLQNSCTEKRDMAKRKSSKSIVAQSIPKGRGSRNNGQMILAGMGAIVLAVIIVAVLALRNSQAQAPTRQAPTAAGDIPGVQAFTGLAHDHVTTTVNYPQTPPVGGPHDPVPQTCGVYTDPIKNEHGVHSLEHGAVWITYQPSLPADQITYLQNLTKQSDHRLLSPYPGIDSPVIITAWGYQLRLDNANDPRLMEFIQKYEQGPTTPELGAECAGETRTLKELGQ
jgi:hypothetical protein